jgi:hypothetical protein
VGVIGGGSLLFRLSAMNLPKNHKKNNASHYKTRIKNYIVNNNTKCLIF